MLPIDPAGILSILLVLKDPLGWPTLRLSYVNMSQLHHL